MICTEEEAKTKWCPFVRFHGSPAHGGGSNRLMADTPNCIGSACMSWRMNPQRYEVKPDGGTAAAPYALQKPLPRVGFCGLAGAPQ